MFGQFFFAMLKKSEAFISLLPCLGGELCWKARLTGTSGMAVNFEILVVTVTTLQHACTKVQACKQNSEDKWHGCQF